MASQLAKAYEFSQTSAFDFFFFSWGSAEFAGLGAEAEPGGVGPGFGGLGGEPGVRRLGGSAGGSGAGSLSATQRQGLGVCHAWAWVWGFKCTPENSGGVHSFPNPGSEAVIHPQMASPEVTWTT